MRGLKVYGWGLVWLAIAWIPASARAAPTRVPLGIPENRARQIREAVPVEPQARPKRPRRVLIWITPPHLMPKDPHRRWNIPYAAFAMRMLGTQTGAFTPVLSDDLSVFAPERLARFDAVVLCNASGPWMTPSAEAMARLSALGATPGAVEAVLRRSLLDWVRAGRGVMAFHYAIGANRHWPQFRALLGAAVAGHPWNEEVGIRVEEPDHPLLAAFGGRRTFRLAEEVFQFLDPYSRARLRVLLSIDTATTNMAVKGLRRPDNDYALAWVKRYGRGRVFYTAIGHRTEHFWNPTLLRFYLAGIQFATGDLEAPADPR